MTGHPNLRIINIHELMCDSLKYGLELGKILTSNIKIFSTLTTIYYDNKLRL